MPPKQSRSDVGEVSRNAIWRERISSEHNVRMKEVLGQADLISTRKAQEAEEHKNDKNYMGTVIERKYTYHPPGHIEINPYNIEEGIFGPAR